jgi:hypothetical protein
MPAQAVGGVRAPAPNNGELLPRPQPAATAPERTPDRDLGGEESRLQKPAAQSAKADRALGSTPPIYHFECTSTSTGEPEADSTTAHPVSLVARAEDAWADSSKRHTCKAESHIARSQRENLTTCFACHRVFQLLPEDGGGGLAA